MALKQFFLLLIVLKLSFSADAQYVIEKSPIVISIASDVATCCNHPSCLDSICYTLPITRNNKEQTVVLLIPQVHTSNTVILYREADYYKYKDNPRYLDWKTLKRDSKMLTEGQPLSLNLTGLENGNYIVEYRSDIGGLMKVRLTTKQ